METYCQRIVIETVPRHFLVERQPWTAVEQMLTLTINVLFEWYDSKNFLYSIGSEEEILYSRPLSNAWLSPRCSRTIFLIQKSCWGHLLFYGIVGSLNFVDLWRGTILLMGRYEETERVHYYFIMYLTTFSSIFSVTPFDFLLGLNIVLAWHGIASASYKILNCWNF